MLARWRKSFFKRAVNSMEEHKQEFAQKLCDRQSEIVVEMEESRQIQ